MKTEIDSLKSRVFVLLCAVAFGCVCALGHSQQRVGADDRPAVAEIPNAFPSPTRPRPALVYIGHVFNVVDGDTVDVEVSYSIRVRLLDCWAPEKHGAEKDAGLASMRNMIKLAAGKDCIVEIPMGTDVKRSLSLDRMLGRVWIAGQDDDLSTQQVNAGFATRSKKAPND